MNVEFLPKRHDGRKSETWAPLEEGLRVPPFSRLCERASLSSSMALIKQAFLMPSLRPGFLNLRAWMLVLIKVSIRIIHRRSRILVVPGSSRLPHLQSCGGGQRRCLNEMCGRDLHSPGLLKHPLPILFDPGNE